jgi:hypothetical protein
VKIIETAEQNLDNTHQLMVDNHSMRLVLQELIVLIKAYPVAVASDLYKTTMTAEDVLHGPFPEPEKSKAYMDGFRAGRIVQEAVNIYTSPDQFAERTVNNHAVCDFIKLLLVKGAHPSDVIDTTYNWVHVHDAHD